MNSKTLRRLATDHAQLHQDLPINYLWPSSTPHSDDLTQVNVLLAGPTHTPFAAGLWKLHLSIPDTYPQQPPTASFRTKIFHPNVNENGQICVETLKRDWDSKLTLRDVLVTISCLLIQPNPDSALNAEAGSLIQHDYASFAQRVELMTSIHATIPASLVAAVKHAQNKGQEAAHESEGDDDVADSMARPEPALRRRRTIAKVRGIRTNEVSPGDAPGRRARRPPPAAPAQASVSQPFVFQAGDDDVFGTPRRHGQASRSGPLSEHVEDDSDHDSEMLEANQENDMRRSPTRSAPTESARTPRRPHGMPVPLGELIIPEQDPGDASVDDTDMEMEPEYPPSPRKSPSKSTSKPHRAAPDRSESSRDAATRSATMITPPNFYDRPLINHGSVGTPAMSPRRADHGRRVAFKLSRRLAPEQQPDSGFLENSFFPPATPARARSTAKRGVLKPRSPNTAHIKLDEAQRRAQLNDKLWEAAGRDIKRYNRGNFDGNMLEKKAARW